MGGSLQKDDSDTVKIKENNSIDELEDLRQQFFVDTDNFEERNLKNNLERLMKFSKMTSKGEIIFEKTKLSDIDTIALIILTYYLGNKLDIDIVETLNSEKISEITKIEKGIVRAQISRLVKRRLIIKPSEGIYRFNPREIDEFLTKLESDYGIS